ncbi:MAG: PrsW family glutamic-type intramembrane protease [Anaerolineae bacterium]|jgi:RsiW-degrading membrane proteinase PrsW (M82 family)|nr:PrsW family glutamic-type intramembrane protease [Anaerolineae bacterium]
MEQLECCVCQVSVPVDAPHLGNRVYCARHWATLSHERPGIWRSGALHVAAAVAFAVIVALLARATQPALEGASLVIAGIALALTPAALWLAFFYAQDRLEPEPKGYVLGVFALGALLASAVAIPVLRDLFRVQDWLGSSPLVNLLGSILIVGFVQEFLKYAAVRYSVYLLPEFDERFDGILYGAAAGLGFGAALNIHYVVASRGANLAAVAIQVVVTALAQASFGGVTGYFLGRAKFEEEPIWWLPAGLALAATLNGVFTVALGSLTRSGSALSGQTTNPWYGLALAAIVAAVTLAALIYLMRRSNRLTLAGADLA